MIKRILGMDDGNHTTWFVCEDCKTEYSDYADLIAFLAQPHDFAVDVRVFCLDDDFYAGGLEKYTELQIKAMWDFLEGYADPPFDLTGDEIFEMFWNSAD